MFVRVVHPGDEKNASNTLYHCKSVFTHTELPKGKTTVVLDGHMPEPVEIVIDPDESDRCCRGVAVYVMNDQGKTIDTPVYP